MDDVLSVLKWMLCALALLPIAIGTGFTIVGGWILPGLIPRSEIERLADELTARYPEDPGGAAFRREEAAWYRADGQEQGKWHRVRKLIHRRRATASRRSAQIFVRRST